MRRIVLFLLTSLDAAVDDPHRYFPPAAPGPSAPGYDPVMEEKEAELISKQDLVLLGRGMYDQWSRYWPTSTEQPFADFINGVPKVVVTSTPLTTRWGRVEAVSGPLPQIVASLRARPGVGDIGVHGSVTLAQGLLAAGLVDELQLAVGPVLDPVGRRLSGQLDSLLRLDLVEALSTTTGGLWLTYRARAQ